MTRKTLLIASLLIVGAMVGLAVVVGSALPDHLSLPTHWGINGQADRFSDKWTALLFPVFVTAAASLLMYALPALEPRKQGLERSQGLYLACWAGLLLLGPLLQLSVISVAYRWPVHATSLVLAGVGIMFALVGNQLGKSRSTYLIGIRTPWTLASEEVWIKTHRLGGKLMVGGGLVLLFAAFLPLRSGVIAALLMPVIVTVALAPVLYSYVLWRRKRAGGQPSA